MNLRKELSLLGGLIKIGRALIKYYHKIDICSIALKTGLIILINSHRRT
jgi:hypothetical protein